MALSIFMSVKAPPMQVTVLADGVISFPNGYKKANNMGNGALQALSTDLIAWPESATSLVILPHPCTAGAAQSAC